MPHRVGAGNLRCVRDGVRLVPVAVELALVGDWLSVLVHDGHLHFPAPGRECLHGEVGGDRDDVALLQARTISTHLWGTF